MQRVITRACSAEISPATCAAATTGCSGCNGSPVNARRGPMSTAACTRARASAADTRTPATSRSTVDVRP